MSYTSLIPYLKRESISRSIHGDLIATSMGGRNVKKSTEERGPPPKYVEAVAKLIADVFF